VKYANEKKGSGERKKYTEGPPQSGGAFPNIGAGVEGDRGGKRQDLTWGDGSRE